MAQAKFYWLSGATWVKVSDSSDSSGTAVNFGTVNAGSSSSNIKMQVRLDTGYQTVSVAPYDLVRIQPSGTYSSWFSLAQDNAGSPGTWVSGGGELAVSSGAEIEPDNPYTFWMKISVPSSASTLDNVTNTKLHLVNYITTDFAVSSITPASGTTIPTSASFSIVFNKPVSSASVTTGNFALTRLSDSSGIPRTAALQGDGITVVVDPAPTLTDANYRLTINKGVLDTEGCQLSETTSATYDFTCISANDAPLYTVVRTANTASSFTASGAHVSGLGASDTLSTLRVAWAKDGTQTADQAVAASQYRDLTGSAITSYLATGYNISGISSFEGYTYRPWVMATETTSGGPTQIGAWNSGATFAVADVTPPSQVVGVASAGSSLTTLTFSWTPATDNIGVAAYDGYYSTGASAPTTATPASLSGITSPRVASGLSSGSTYYLYVRARDAAGNLEAWSSACTGATASSVPSFDLARVSTGKLLYEKFTTGVGALVSAGGATAVVSGGIMHAYRDAVAGCVYAKSQTSATSGYIIGSVKLKTSTSQGSLQFLQVTPSVVYWQLMLLTDRIQILESETVRSTATVAVGTSVTHTLAFKQNGRAHSYWYDGSGSAAYNGSVSSGYNTTSVRIMGTGSNAASDGCTIDDLSAHSSWLVTCSVPATGSYKLRVRDAASGVVYTGTSGVNSVNVDISGVGKVLDIVEVLDGSTSAVLDTLTLTDDVFGGDVYSYTAGG